ncbi:hypothetical protein TCE0_033r09421 [Talaromyces pinophilus]|uniref:Uncharacterized protein n=1 Tax=Talaromyces pinophilus TaxID=128442 RepID=A0A6V8HJZ7_TALPI|nr:hypothetical protein TCE0_033r09421 [Talaromyces pinophilus]
MDCAVSQEIIEKLKKQIRRALALYEILSSSPDQPTLLELLESAKNELKRIQDEISDREYLLSIRTQLNDAEARFEDLKPRIHAKILELHDLLKPTDMIDDAEEANVIGKAERLWKKIDRIVCEPVPPRKYYEPMLTFGFKPVRDYTPRK